MPNNRINPNWKFRCAPLLPLMRHVNFSEENLHFSSSNRKALKDISLILQVMPRQI
jgi:hypothetical protein